MSWFDWFARESSAGDMCDRIGHHFTWVPEWKMFFCQRCGITAKGPSDDR